MAVQWKVHLRRIASTGAEEVTKEYQDQADSLKGATLPNGQKYEVWLKSRREDGKNTGP
jgi:hypothetical protein